MVQRVHGANRPRPLASARSIIALVLREMATTSGRASGGYLWAILEPAAGIALLTIVFSLAFRAPPLGTSFPVFYATGILPFMMYNDIGNRLGRAIRFSKPLLFYPRLTFADALLARFFLAVLTQIVVFCLVTTGVLLLADGGAILHVPSIVIAIAMTAALGIGIGTLNCFLFSQFPAWERIWGILNRPMFIISGIFFTFESVPPEYREYLWYNPLIHIIGQMRRGFYPTYEAPFVTHIYVFGIALVTLVAGLVLLSRYHRDLIDS